MLDGIVRAGGGLGIFLFGMATLTAGLRTLAGASLQRVIGKFTRSPAGGAATGAVVTTIVQSSSATTVAAVGFVGAGLLTLSQAVGVIFGANVGSTMTGWIVAFVGFELKLSVVCPPLVLAGALLHHFGRRRWKSVGTALAGFGLIFVGIGFMQEGMSQFEGWLTPETLPRDTWLGRLLLIGLGVAITSVTQSSAAGVAMSLTALDAGAISFPQAAAMVIGMDVGTTITAVLASIGGSVNARRTSLAHVVFNLMTATGAYFFLDGYIAGVGLLFPGALESQPEFCLVGFHTTFNTLGTLVAIPFTHRFARWIEHLLRSTDDPWSSALDRSLLAQPDVAFAAVVTVDRHLVRQALRETRRLLASPRGDSVETERASSALVESAQYLSDVIGRPELSGRLVGEQYPTLLHLQDHLERLVHRLDHPPPTVESDPHMSESRERLASILDEFRRDGVTPEVEESARSLWVELRESEDQQREQLLRSTRERVESTLRALDRLDEHHWLLRVAHHVYRLLHHLGRLEPAGPGQREGELPSGGSPPTTG